MNGGFPKSNPNGRSPTRRGRAAAKILDEARGESEPEEISPLSAGVRAAGEFEQCSNTFRHEVRRYSASGLTHRTGSGTASYPATNGPARVRTPSRSFCWDSEASIRVAHRRCQGGGGTCVPIHYPNWLIEISPADGGREWMEIHSFGHTCSPCRCGNLHCVRSGTAGSELTGRQWGGP